jgi:hypothetical protein
VSSKTVSIKETTTTTVGTDVSNEKPTTEGNPTIPKCCEEDIARRLIAKFVDEQQVKKAAYDEEDDDGGDEDTSCEKECGIYQYPDGPY